MSCKCHACGMKYKVDFVVTDDLWEKIKPEGSDEGCGMLCGPCIALKLESFGEYRCYEIKDT